MSNVAEKEEISSFLKPETELEHKLISDKEFIEGVLWGEPREGHPEGQVIFHVAMCWLMLIYILNQVTVRN